MTSLNPKIDLPPLEKVQAAGCIDRVLKIGVLCQRDIKLRTEMTVSDAISISDAAAELVKIALAQRDRKKS